VRSRGQDSEQGLRSWVRVFEVDPTLLAGIDAAVARPLVRSTTVEMIEVPASTALPRRVSDAGVAGAMVIQGVLAGTTWVGERRSVELLGRRDVFAVGAPAASWTSLDLARVAILDDDFVASVQRFPSIVALLMRRMAERADDLAQRLAIVSIRQLDDRLLALLRHLAERWGQPDGDRVHIPLRLSHELLADMTCAQRPSVSVAAKELTRRGLVDRGPRGSWILLPEPADAPGPSALAAATFGSAATVSRITQPLALPSGH
jgi:CRP/FNR family transcriptional regulator, cyclic AMP receptor protein